MTTKHTPGPWDYKCAPNGDCGIISEEMYILAETFSAIRAQDENAQAESVANARLIAAAPDMLEALKKFASWDQCWPGNINLEGVCELGRAAIAKAEGRDMNRRTRNE